MNFLSFLLLVVSPIVDPAVPSLASAEIGIQSPLESRPITSIAFLALEMQNQPPPKPPKPSRVQGTADALLARFGHGMLQPPIAGSAASARSANTSLTATRDPARRVAVVAVRNNPGAQPNIGTAELADPFHDPNNIFAALIGSPKDVRLPDCGLERVGVDFSDASLAAALDGPLEGAGSVPTAMLPGAGWISDEILPSLDTRIAIFAPTTFGSGAGGTIFGDWEMLVTTMASVSASTEEARFWSPRRVYDTARRAGLLRQPEQEDFLGVWPIVVVCSTVRVSGDRGVVFIG